jgi:hypothetical protein
VSAISQRMTDRLNRYAARINRQIAQFPPQYQELPAIMEDPPMATQAEVDALQEQLAELRAHSALENTRMNNREMKSRFEACTFCIRCPHAQQARYQTTPNSRLKGSKTNAQTLFASESAVVYAA